MEYPLTVGSRQVGKVQMVGEGLYYQISCHAELFGSVMYRLVAVCNGRRENVGILSPEGGGYSLSRKIPRAHFGGGEVSFLLLPSHEPMEGKFVPISPEEPFQYLEKLKDAYLTKQKDRLGLIIPE